MAFDADQVRSLIESKLSEQGIEVNSFGSMVALELGPKVQELASKILEAAAEQGAAALSEASEGEEPAPTPAPADGDALKESFTSIREAVTDIEAGKTQVDVLKSLLNACSSFCARVALLIVKGDKGIGWLAQGFGHTPPFSDENIKKVSVPLQADTFFRDVYTECATYHGAGEPQGDNLKFFERIGAFVPRQVIAVPLVIKGKVVAILYGDGGSEVAEVAAPDIVVTLVSVAAMSIKLIPLKTRPEESANGSAKFVGSDSGSFRKIGDATPRPQPSPVRAATPPPEPEPAPAPEPEPPPSPAPPPSEESMSPEEAKQHDDAKRFARLLVSEIKLYNEAKVAVGKRNKDLYERLKEDIERSRQMYNERFPAKITSTTNYFFEELVKQLADGDRSALGI